MGPACGGGPETALHILCKEIIRDELRLTLPQEFAVHGTYERLISEAREMVFERVTLEFRDHVEVIPDLRLQVDDLNLFVEIAVTHPCGEEKIARLKQLGTAAVEIDMSSVPRNAPPQDVRRAVLSTAPRRWLFNAKIESALEDMRLRERQDADAAAKRLASSRETQDRGLLPNSSERQRAEAAHQGSRRATCSETARTSRNSDRRNRLLHGPVRDLAISCSCDASAAKDSIIIASSLQTISSHASLEEGYVQATSLN
jgi:hypothetical protein